MNHSFNADKKNSDDLSLYPNKFSSNNEIQCKNI